MFPWLSLFCRFLVFLMCWWSNPTFTPKKSPDRWEYIAVAKNFSDHSNELRSFGYPMLIRFTMIISDTNWEKVLMLIQVMLSIFLT